MAARRNLDETRTLVLDAGLELLEEAGYSLDNSEVSLIDACRRAGLGTAGSGYKIWPTQRDFRTDLLRHALDVANEALLRTDQLVAALEDAGDDPDLSTLIRVASQDSAEVMVGAAELYRNVAIWLAAGNDDELRARYVESQRLLLAELATLYGGLLELFEHEMKPPFTIELMTLAIAAELNGIAMWCSYSDDVGVGDIVRLTGPDDTPERWHLLGCVVEAIVEAFTRPKGRGGDAEPTT